MLNLIYPLIAVIAESAGKTVDKISFTQTHITPRQMMLLTFIVMTLCLLLFLLFTKSAFPTLSLISISLVLLIGMVSFASNIFDELSLKVDDLSLREPLNDFQPILAGLIGYFLFPSEREPIYLFMFIISIFIVYYGTHRRKLRNFQIRGMHFLLLAVVFESILPSIYSVALNKISPAYLAFFRVFGVLIFSLLFFQVKPIFETLSYKMTSYSILAGVIYAIGAIVSLIAIDLLGVTQAMLLLLLGPLLRYTSGYFILKEKVRMGEMLSSLLLAILVLTTIFI